MSNTSPLKNKSIEELDLTKYNYNENEKNPYLR